MSQVGGFNLAIRQTTSEHEFKIVSLSPLRIKRREFFLSKLRRRRRRRRDQLEGGTFFTLKWPLSLAKWSTEAKQNNEHSLMMSCQLFPLPFQFS